MSGLGSASASMSTVVASFSPSESRESASCSPSTQQGLWKYGGLITLLTSQAHLQMHDGTFRLRPHKSPSSGVPPILQQKGRSQRARRREAPGAVSGQRLFPSSVGQEVWASVRATGSMWCRWHSERQEAAGACTAAEAFSFSVEVSTVPGLTPLSLSPR